MILFLTTAANRFPIDRYLASWGRPFLGALVPVPYARGLAWRRHPPGVYVFADLELLTEDARARAAALCDALRRRGGECLVLNHPASSLRRTDLLAALHADGLNSFRAHGLDADLDAVRLPAFLRVANDHRGNRSELLRSRAALEEAVRQARVRRAPGEEWLIVEFCDTADARGWYRKYAAFRVGARILPRHLFAGPDWCLKRSADAPEGVREEEWAYVTGNPHRAELLAIFERARLEYGRIDYALRGGRIETWEINTNPMILRPRHRWETGRLGVHQRFAEELAQAWEDVDQRVPRAGAPWGERARTVARIAWESLEGVPRLQAALRRARRA